MQLATMNLSEQFYNPATGEAIMTPENGINEEASSLLAYWIDEIIVEPTFRSKEIEDAWNEYLSALESEIHMHRDHQNVLRNFITTYNSTEKQLHAYLLSAYTGCNPGNELVWFVLDCGLEE